LGLVADLLENLNVVQNVLGQIRDVDDRPLRSAFVAGHDADKDKD
jgi:hypothetical protein